MASAVTGSHATERREAAACAKDGNTPGGQGRGGDCIFRARVFVREQVMALRGLLEDDASLTFFAPLLGSGAGSGLLYSTSA